MAVGTRREIEGATPARPMGDAARRGPTQLLATGRMACVGALAAGVAHEINNSLAFLLANLEFASDSAAGLSPVEPAVAELRTALGEARLGAERVRQLTRDLQAFSRTGDGARGPVDVERLLESCLQLAAADIRRRARLVRELGHVPRVEAEEAPLAHVFLNLLLNAAQAIPKGDAQRNEVRVATRLGPDGRVAVEIGDSGEGIPEPVRPRLFEPFFTTKPAGTGLGLYLCQTVVEALGGEMEVESAAGRGSLFRVLLPAADAEPRSAATRPQGVARRGRVLVVDDEPMIAVTLARVLAAHEVIAVPAGREALARISAGEDFDVILCDLVMPGMSGMELHAEISERAPELARRIVFLTGGIYMPHAREFVERVPNVLVEKPFDTASLRALVAERVREQAA